MKKFFLLVLISALLSSCDDDGNNIDGPFAVSDEANMIVNYYTRECVGEGTFQCLLVQEGDLMGTETWYNFYDGIEGFDFEPGFRYQLIVRKTNVDNPPADGSSIDYKLLTVISKKKMQ